MSDHQSFLLKRIFLARHGESIANLNKQISGQLDVPLSPKGKDQALWLKEVLQHERLSAIYSSSLSRTIETAQPTADHHQLKIRIRDGLKELHFGNLQGKKGEGMDSKASKLWKENSVVKKATNLDGGETYYSFEKRVKKCLTDVMDNSSGSILIVGHRNTNEVILAKLLALGSAANLNINVKNKYVYEIEFGEKIQVSTIRLGGEHHGKKFSGLKDD